MNRSQYQLNRYFNRWGIKNGGTRFYIPAMTGCLGLVLSPHMLIVTISDDTAGSAQEVWPLYCRVVAIILAIPVNIAMFRRPVLKAVVGVTATVVAVAIVCALPTIGVWLRA